jgi:hypothetical protein
VGTTGRRCLNVQAAVLPSLSMASISIPIKRAVEERRATSAASEEVCWRLQQHL